VWWKVHPFELPNESGRPRYFTGNVVRITYRPLSTPSRSMSWHWMGTTELFMLSGDGGVSTSSGLCSDDVFHLQLLLSQRWCVTTWPDFL
jgi:hypothetical protein